MGWDKTIYFAYGSNMCTRRLRERVPSAKALRIARLEGHSFRFHKRSTDRSGKADAFETANPEDIVWGVVFEIDSSEKPSLDRAEGLGRGYRERTVRVVDENNIGHYASLYIASQDVIDADLVPYSWYKRFVVEGARQHGLPAGYIARIDAMPATEDPDRERDASMRELTVDY